MKLKDLGMEKEFATWLANVKKERGKEFNLGDYVILDEDVCGLKRGMKGYVRGLSPENRTIRVEFIDKHFDGWLWKSRFIKV